MTIVVSVKVNDGIVLAADSATTLMKSSGEVVNVYNSANKVFNLVKGVPIGAMTYGSGSIGKASIATLSKDLRVLLGAPGTDYHLDETTYTLEEVANLARRFLFEEKYLTEYPAGHPGFDMGYRICGFSRPGDVAEAWEIRITGDQCAPPARLYDDDDFGPRWEGERDPLDRLICGLGSRFADALTTLGVPYGDAIDLQRQLVPLLAAPLHHPAMPIQDAIDLAKFLAGTTARFMEFSLGPATVGGRIELASITKHEGFKWVSRKHYYTAEFNLGTTDHVR